MPSNHYCLKTDLDLFTTTPMQVAVDKMYWVDYATKTNVTNDGPIEFIITGSSDYIDLANSYLELVAEITKSDGTAITATSKVGPVNLWLHSMFSKVDLELNNVLVTDSTNNYPYRAILETLLHTTTEAKESQLTQALYYKDTPGKMDVKDPTLATGPNEGLTTRAKFISSGKKVQLMDRLHLDLWQQPKLLLNHVDVKLRFIRHTPEFALMGEDGPYKIKISTAVMHICKCKPTNDVLLAHANTLKNNTAKYPIRRVTTKNYQISKGDLQLTKDDVFLGDVPDVLVLAIVDGGAFSGDLAKNPFNFEGNKLTYLSILVDGQPRPQKEWNFDFDNDLTLQGYRALFPHVNKGVDFGRDEFSKGYAIHQIDLSADQSGYDMIKSPNTTGNVRIEMKFKKGPTEPKVLFVMGVFLSTIEIDNNREVRFDYR